MHCVPGYQARTPPLTDIAGLVARGFLALCPDVSVSVSPFYDEHQILERPAPSPIRDIYL